MKTIGNLLALSIVCTQLYGTAPTVAQRQASHLTDKVFGKHGTQSKNSHRQEIELLIHDLLKATESQRVCIAKRVLHFLDRDIKGIQQALTNDPLNKSAYNHSFFILQAQKQHFKDYIKESSGAIPWYKRLWEKIEACTYYVCENVADKKCQTFVEKVALTLDFYLNFEREHILTDYTKTLHLFAGHGAHSLPPILTMWQDPRLRTQLLRRIKKNHSSLRPQAAEGVDALIGVAGDELMGLTEGVTEEMVETALAQTTAIAEEAVKDVSADGVASAAEDTLEKTVGTSEEKVAEEFGHDALEDTEALEMGDEAAASKGTEEGEGTEKKQSNREKRRADRNAKREALEAEESADLKDASTSKIKKAWIMAKQFKRTLVKKIGLRSALDFTEDYITGPVNDLYKKYIYDTFLSKVEDNALKKGLDALPHWLRGAVDITIQMNIIMGGGLVVTWANMDDAKVYKKYAKANTAIGALNAQFKTEITQQTAKKKQLDVDTFGKTVDTISDERTALIETHTAEQMYIQKASIDQAPKSSYTLTVQDEKRTGTTESPLVTDQRFTLAKMLTPEGVSNWYNVFRSGNWVFMPELNGLYQTQLVKLTGKNAKTQAAEALYNSVFTEYIPSTANSYTITADCTLISYAEPFFFGIIFNNARWISGVPDRYQQHRFVGLYGNNGKICIVLDESTNSTDQERSGGAPGTQWPAYKALQHPEKYMIQTKLMSVPKTPATFTVSITTTPTKVSATISSSLQGASKKDITKDGLNLPVYSFHGIGFMSAGCVAQFKLTAPKELTYSSAQIDKFKRLVSS